MAPFTSASATSAKKAGAQPEIIPAASNSLLLAIFTALPKPEIILHRLSSPKNGVILAFLAAARFGIQIA